MDGYKENRGIPLPKGKSFNLTKPDSLEKPYRWLMDRMREKIGPAPAGVDYPVWAWHTWEFERRAPDPQQRGLCKTHGSKGAADAGRARFSSRADGF